MFVGIDQVLSRSSLTRKSGPVLHIRTHRPVVKEWKPYPDPVRYRISFGPVLTQILGRVLVTREDKKRKLNMSRT